MVALEEKNLQKLERLIYILDENLTKGDFVNAFEKVMELVLKIQKQMAEAIDRLEETYQNLLTKVRNDHTSSLKDLKGQVNQVFVGERLDKMEGGMKKHMADIQTMINQTIDRKLREVDIRMTKVRDGYTPVKGKDYFDGLPGLPGKDADKKKLEELEKRLNQLAQSAASRSRFGVRKIPMLRVIDLTSTSDAATFTVPRDTVRVHMVWSTQFPIILRPDVDFTLSGQTLTIISGQVGTIQAGQTVTALIETLFYA